MFNTEFFSFAWKSFGVRYLTRRVNFAKESLCEWYLSDLQPFVNHVLQVVTKSVKEFSVRGIIQANPRSRAASQFGAQKGDRASKRLTRRTATHNATPDSRARHAAIAFR